MMLATFVPARKTVVDTTTALRGFLEAWRRRMGADPSAACIATFTAQSALESGWWRSMWNFNPSNIKAGQKYQGLYTCIRLNERENGVYVWYSPTGRERPPGTVFDQLHDVPEGHPQTRMRAFEDFDDGLNDKMDFFAELRWLKAREYAEQGLVDPYVRECKRQNYFTAELGPYLRSVVSIQAKLLPDAEEVIRNGLPLPQLEPVNDDELCRDMAVCMRVNLPDWLVAKVRVQQSEHVDFVLEELVRKQRDEDIRNAGN